MKKLVSLLLVLSMVCMLIPAVAEVAADTVVGEWYASDMIQGETTVHLADMGMSYVMILNEDGTMVMTMSRGGMEESQGGTWEITDGKIIVTAVEEDFTSTLEVVPQEDGTLLAMDEGMSMVFGREAPVAATIGFAEVNPDAQPEDFNGEWEFVNLVAMGMTLDAELAVSMGAISETGTLIIEDGAVTATGGFKNLVDGTTMTFADGAYSDIIMEGVMGFYMYLLQDGMLKFVMEMGESMEFYFVKAEAAE